MKRHLATALLATALAGPAHALNITLDAESLKDAIGNAMPVTGLVVLTAGTSGSFFGPTATSFTEGDEIEIFRWDLAAFGLDGILQDATSDLPFSGAWSQGDPLRIYWYPTLDLSATEPGLGTEYGTYSDSIGLDGSAPWVTGAEGDTISFKFFTDDASLLNPGGSNPAAAGLASLVVVPEPGTVAFGAIVWAAVGLVRPRRRAAGGLG